MDILAHGLWTAAVYKGAKDKSGKKLNVWWAVFFGVAPDIFSFGVFSLDLLFHYGIHRPEFFSGPGVAGERIVPQYVYTLYNWTHSLLIFASVFCLIWLLRRRPLWEMGGWALHILIDVPTHSSLFFPTPVFWPVSTIHFDGMSWGTPWFMALNYLALAAVWLGIILKGRRKKLDNPSSDYL